MIEPQTKERTNGHRRESELGFDHPTLAADYDQALDAARAELAALGVDLSAARHQRGIAERKARARELVRTTTGNRPQWFAVVETAIVTTGNALVLALMLILSFVLPPVALLGLGWAEYQRVALGVALFDAPRAHLMALVAVASYLGLLVVAAARTYNHEQPPRPVWSIRLWGRKVAYALGVGRGWHPRGVTSDQQLHSAITRLGWLIIALGTVGTLADELTTYNGTWYRALASIATESDLITLLALVGGCLLTAGLLAGMSFIVEFVHAKYRALMPEGSADFFASASDIASAEKEAELTYLRALIERAKSSAE